MPDSMGTKSILELNDDDTLNLFAEVIHKIKNSLGGIGGFAALLERDLGPEDPRTTLSRRIQDGVIRINDFTIQLMTFLNTPDPSFQSMNAVPVIKQAWAEYAEESAVPENNLNLENRDASPSVRLIADPETFRILALHALRFGCSIGGRIDGVRLNVETDRSVVFEVLSPNNLKTQEGSELTLSYLRTNGPIESKLSLYIVIKMAKLNGASVSLSLNDPDKAILSVHFSKGK